MESSLTNDAVLEEHIPWETYKTTGQISGRDFAIIKRFDKSTETAKGSALEEDPVPVFEALFSVLRSISHEGTVQYTLALLDEIITMDPAKINDMSKPSAQHPGAPAPDRAQILSRLLSREDWFTQAKAAKLLSAVLKAGQEESPTIKGQFLEWLTGQLRQPTFGEESVLVAAGALAGLLRSRDVRKEYSTGVSLLTKCLKTSQNEHSSIRAQVLYNLGLCLWQLSFDENGLKELEKSDVVTPLCNLLKEGNKEKVMRISLMTLLRMVSSGAEKTQSEMVEAGLPRIIRIRSNQAWSDEDIPEVLKELDEALDTSVAALSSFDKYRAEVLSGALDWTPMHTNSQFWAENINAIVGTDREIIRCLIKLLETSRDPKVLAVACHDLGMFAEVHPHGRWIINNLGGKPFVMAQMASEHAEVQKHALVCVQRLMLSREKLDFLAHSTGTAGPGAAAATA